MPPQIVPAAKGNPKAERDVGSDTFAAFGTMQAAFARTAEAVADEIAVQMRSGFSNLAEAATALLGAKTLSDAFEANAGLARKTFEAMLAGSSKLSEIGVRFATESLHPPGGARLG
jgi:hypothetical protein